jgi:predicted TIM-barrel fold metal-dependent hydrolase
MPVEARAYSRPLPNPEWLGKRTEEILEPDLPIVDPHHHLWDHPGSRYLLDELLADVGSGHNIVATVFIQCGSGYRTSGPEDYHPQIKTLTEVARECPDVKIVLNHFGGPLGVGPYKRDEVFPGWRTDIKALAACSNVYVKLGGLAMIVNAFDFHLEVTT